MCERSLQAGFQPFYLHVLVFSAISIYFFKEERDILDIVGVYFRINGLYIYLMQYVHFSVDFRCTGVTADFLHKTHQAEHKNIARQPILKFLVLRPVRFWPYKIIPLFWNPKLCGDEGLIESQ